MADTNTTHLNLIKQDENSAPDVAKDNSNWDAIDTAVGNSVMVTPQTFTTAQKEQAQANLGLTNAMATVSGLGFLATFVKSIPLDPGMKLTIQGGVTAYWLAISMSTTTTYRGMWLLCRQGSNGRTTATPVLDSNVVSITGSESSSEFIVSKSSTSSAYIILISLYSSGSAMPEIVVTPIEAN